MLPQGNPFLLITIGQFCRKNVALKKIVSAVFLDKKFSCKSSDVKSTEDRILCINSKSMVIKPLTY